MFGRWSMISIFHVCVFQTSYRVPNVWHIIYMFDISSYHRFSCLYITDIYTISLMFNVSSMIIALHVCVSQRYIPCPSCSSYHPWPSFCMLVYSRDKFFVLNIVHFIYDRHNLYLCPPEINTVSAIFDKSSMRIVVYVCVVNSFISFLIVRHLIHDHQT